MLLCLVPGKTADLQWIHLAPWNLPEFMAVGGSGATLGLNFLMLKSKQRYPQACKTALYPFLNINEPIISAARSLSFGLGIGSCWFRASSSNIDYAVHITGLVATVLP
jgi:hypothetical protein